MADFQQVAPQVATRLGQDLQLTPQQAAGIIGQLGYESAGLQAINERKPVVPGSRGGFGWAQWTGPRRRQFETFAAQNGLDITDPEANYRFLVHELTNTPEGRVLPAIRQAKDAQTAGRIFTDQFLRPGVPAYDRRASWTERALNAIIPAAQAAEQSRRPTAWKDVIAKPEYQALGPEQKAAAQQQYFDQVVAPRVPEGKLEEARNQFFTQYPVDYMRLEMSHEDPPEPVSENPAVGLGAGIGAGVGTVALNAQRYLGQGIRGLGADRVGNWLVNDADRGLQNLQSQLEPYRQVSPFSAGAGELLGNVAATLPVGGLLASGVRAAAPALGAASPAAMRTAEALRTWGMQTGAAPATLAGRAGNMALRAGAGGATGATAGALVNPEDAQTAGIVGAAFPVAATAIGRGAQALGRSLSGGEVSQPVRNLAARAQELGIRIPADRIADSRPLNAISSSLNYVPFSGRAVTEARMQSDLNRAVSRTFGQESENVTQALRQASDDLGAKFDSVLRNTAVRVDDQLLDDLARAESQALQELPEPQARVIVNQINEILKQGGAGQIEGQLAYNIKRTLDRIAKRNSPEGWYANELRKTLMDALNRSLGPDEAAKFATTRRQYGNMLSLEQLAQNGVEGDISIARLANMRNIRNRELQEIADIAAQFLRPREGQHGAAQRVLALGLTGMAGGPAAAVASVGAGRLANTMLNSQAARNALMGTQSNTALANALRQALPASYRTAPVISAQ